MWLLFLILFFILSKHRFIFKIVQRQHGCAFCFLDGTNESQDFVIQECLTSQEVEPQLTVRRDPQVEEQLRLTQEKLCLKEKEVNGGYHE